MGAQLVISAQLRYESTTSLASIPQFPGNVINLARNCVSEAKSQPNKYIRLLPIVWLPTSSLPIFTENPIA